MNAAIVNNDLVNSQEARGSNILDPAFSGEYVSYAIIERGAMSLTTNTSLSYTLQYDAHVNGVFIPNAFDSFANNLARTSQVHTRRSADPLPRHTLGV